MATWNNVGKLSLKFLTGTNKMKLGKDPLNTERNQYYPPNEKRVDANTNYLGQLDRDNL